MCDILRYEKHHDALAKKVKLVYKSLIRVLCETRTALLTHNEGLTVYIFEPRMYQLIFSSRLETAETFRGWVLEEVLLSIRKTNDYRSKMQLDNIDMFQVLKKHIG